MWSKTWPCMHLCLLHSIKPGYSFLYSKYNYMHTASNLSFHTVSVTVQSHTCRCMQALFSTWVVFSRVLWLQKATTLVPSKECTGTSFLDSNTSKFKKFENGFMWVIWQNCKMKFMLKWFQTKHHLINFKSSSERVLEPNDLRGYKWVVTALSEPDKCSPGDQYVALAYVRVALQCTVHRLQS
jgi:hypothetical protein